VRPVRVAERFSLRKLRPTKAPQCELKMPGGVGQIKQRFGIFTGSLAEAEDLRSGAPC
jgi:hypothetical protein